MPVRSLLPALLAVVLLVPAVALCAPAPARGATAPELWPDQQRAFYFDGPAWLLSEDQRKALLGMSDAERGAFIEQFLSAADLPSVSADQLAEAIDRRRRLMRQAFPTPLDVRARLLFLHGPPAERVVVDCGETFHPLEIWRYPEPQAQKEGELRALLPYQPGPGQPWRLWTPYDTKKALYTDEMGYYLKQWHELNNKVFQARRFDLQACEQTRSVDEATGIRACGTSGATGRPRRTCCRSSTRRPTWGRGSSRPWRRPCRRRRSRCPRATSRSTSPTPGASAW